MKTLYLSTLLLILSHLLLLGQSNIYPSSGNITIYDYSPGLLLQRNTSIGGFTQGIQTRLQDGTDNWYFGALHTGQWIVSKGDFQNSKFSILENGNVGIGTTEPVAPLQIGNGGNNSNLSYRGLILWGGYATTNTRQQNLISFKATDNINTDPFNDTSSESLKNFHMGILSDNAYFNNDRFSIVQGGIERLTICGYSNNGNVGIGTTNPGIYKLNVNGNIRANEIVVNTEGADFVFAPDYNLLSLPEVEKFIKENKHLPDLASSTEMKEKGMNVSEMQTKLLQKIEELTLYVIEQKKEIESLKQDVIKLNIR